jgi:hypothetical protein
MEYSIIIEKSFSCFHEVIIDINCLWLENDARNQFVDNQEVYRSASAPNEKRRQKVRSKAKQKNPAYHEVGKSFDRLYEFFIWFI